MFNSIISKQYHKDILLSKPKKLIPSCSTKLFTKEQ